MQTTIQKRVSVLDTIENRMAAALKQSGIAAEVTFCRRDMFSVLVADAAQFAKAKSIVAQVAGAAFDSEDCDEEIGNIAFYRF